MKIKTTRSENNNTKKALVFVFGYAEARKGTEAEGRLSVPVFTIQALSLMLPQVQKEATT